MKLAAVVDVTNRVFSCTFNLIRELILFCLKWHSESEFQLIAKSFEIFYLPEAHLVSELVMIAGCSIDIDRDTDADFVIYVSTTNQDFLRHL